jgi:hypothetical protein
MARPYLSTIAVAWGRSAIFIWKGIFVSVSKLGRKDLFAATIEQHGSPKGRCSTDSEVEKVMVMLSSHQVHSLDQICLEIRQTTGIKIKRSMLIRWLIDGFLSAPLQYEEAQNAEEVHHIISQAVQSR